MTIRQKFTSTKDAITFGQYKGRKLKYILEQDAQYIVWLCNEGAIEVSKRISNIAKELAEEQRFERAVRRIQSYSTRSNYSYDPSDDFVYGGCDPNMWGDIGF